MGNKDWRSIGFPKELYKIIEEFVEDKTNGYDSANEFIRDSARKLLRELKQLKGK